MYYIGVVIFVWFFQPSAKKRNGELDIRPRSLEIKKLLANILYGSAASFSFNLVIPSWTFIMYYVSDVLLVTNNSEKLLTIFFM